MNHPNWKAADSFVALRWLMAVGVILISVAYARRLPAQDVSAARELAITVNQVLTRYIRVHDDLFTVSLRRLIPIPSVFEAIDFRAHMDSLRAIRATLDSTKTGIRHQLETAEQTGTLRSFLTALDDYIGALDTTVLALEQISRRLYQKSQNPAHYVWEEYDHDIDEYQAAIALYYARGADLSALYRSLP